MGLEINFNQRTIDALKSPLSRPRDEYRDANELGLYLYVTSTGKKTFYLYKFFRNEPVRIKLGCYPDLSVSAAKEQARKLKGKMALGEDPREACKRNESSQVTLKQIAHEYLEAKRDRLSPKTIESYESINRNGLLGFMNRPIAAVSKSRLISLHAALTNERGKHAADTALRAFGMYFNFFADRYEYVGINPVHTLSLNKLWNTKISDRRDTYIKDEDLPKWFESVIQHGNGTERDYLLVLLFTGMRKSETAHLKWDDVDLEKRLFTARKTKNGNPHTLPMSQFLFELYTARKAKAVGSYVFPSARNPNRPLCPDLLSSRFRKKCEVKFTLHDLRRTFATAADRLGLPDRTIKALLNHKSGNDVTEGYIMREADRLREPLEKIALRFIDLFTDSNSVKKRNMI